MDEFNHPEKEVETGIAESNYGADDMEQGIASSADCWELVGSSPGSPLPEARGDVTALEEAIASACNSGSLVQDNYFGCADSRVDDAVLPISTAMADKQSDDDGHSSDRSDGLVSLASDTGANDGDHTDDADHMSHDDGLHNDDHMHHNDTYQDDLPDCDQVQHGVHHHNVMMYHNELMEHDDRWRIEDETHFESIMHIDENSAYCVDLSGHACEILESAAVPNVPLVHGFGTSSGFESPSYSPMSLHGTGDNGMSMQQALVEGSSSTVLLEETGSEVTNQVTQAQVSVDAQHGTINTYNKRQNKGIVCVSWIWTQLIRWQTQLGHANTIWSVALAAAVMGILVLGRGWQRLQDQNQSLRSQLWAKEKRIRQLMFQLMQTKDALAKVRRVPVICVKPSLQIPQDNF